VKQNFHVGMRTLKTSLSVFVIVLVSAFIPIDPQIAALSAVFSQRADVTSSLSFGLRRTLAIVCGAFASLVFIFLHNLLPDHYLITALLGGLGILITIQTNLLVKNPQGVIGGSATFLVIQYSSGQSIYLCPASGIGYLPWCHYRCWYRVHFSKRPSCPLDPYLQ